MLIVNWQFPCTQYWQQQRYYATLRYATNNPAHDKINKTAFAPSEDSAQPGHPPSLIRVFAVRMKKA